MDSVRFFDAQALEQSISRPAPATTHEEAWETAQVFEGMMLGQLMKHMMSGLKADGPFGGGFAETMWQDMLVEQAGDQASIAGGIGIAREVYEVLIADLPVAVAGDGHESEEG